MEVNENFVPLYHNQTTIINHTKNITIMTTKSWNIGETRTMDFCKKITFEAAGFEQYVIEGNPTDGFGTYRRITRDNLRVVNGRVNGRSILGKEYLTERNFKKYAKVYEWAKDFPVFVAVGKMTFIRVK